MTSPRAATAHEQRPIVVKLGGEVIAGPQLAAVAGDLALLAPQGVVVVHGGGPQATALQEKLGQTPVKIAGRRVTDAATLDVMKMVLAGQLNVDLCAALLRANRRGELDAIVWQDCPLDVLAQQIVAESACREYTEDELFDLMRRAWPYRQLSRADFDAILKMTAEGFSTRRGRRAALVHRDEVNRVVRGRRGARLVAQTCGGAIPEVADYRVMLEPEDTFIGTVNFVDEYTNTDSGSHSFRKNETSLWKRTFRGIYQKKNTIHHHQRTFNFTTEVGVSRSIQKVDLCSFPANSTVFSFNCNSALAFKFAGVHYTFLHLFVRRECTRVL